MTTDLPLARYRDVFGLGEFCAMFSAHIVSLLGDVIAAVALTVLVYERTGSPALAAATFSLAFIPYLIGGTLLSAVVDRLPARRVLVGCDVVSAALVAVMAIPAVPIPVLLALLVVLSLIAPVFSGVRNATLAEVLPAGPTFILGRSLIRMVSQLAQVLGNGAGGLLLILFSPHGVLAVDAGSFVVSALLLQLGTRHRPARIARSESSLVRDSLSGLRELLGRPVLRRLFAFGWLLPACTGAPEALAAPYAHELGRPSSAVGFFLIGLPAGSAISDLLVARLVSGPGQRRLS